MPPKEIIVPRTPNIYKFLGHHYILRRSVVFIMDTEFESIFYKEKASSYISSYFDRMAPDDYFGYISLEKGLFSNDIVLEPKCRNTHTKRIFLEDANKKASELLF